MLIAALPCQQQEACIKGGGRGARVVGYARTAYAVLCFRRRGELKRRDVSWFLFPPSSSNSVNGVVVKELWQPQKAMWQGPCALRLWP